MLETIWDLPYKINDTISRSYFLHSIKNPIGATAANDKANLLDSNWISHLESNEGGGYNNSDKIEDGFVS